MIQKALTIIVVMLATLGWYKLWLSAQRNVSHIGTIAASPSGTQSKTAERSVKSEEYVNKKYGFRFSLPETWKGYSILTSAWEGYVLRERGDTTVTSGPIISIRHPLWTFADPRQDIPIMVLTIAQWNDLQAAKFHIGAAPIDPGELGRNAKYVFALPARYNYAFPTGFEEVDRIIRSHPLHSFNP